VLCYVPPIKKHGSDSHALQVVIKVVSSETARSVLKMPKPQDFGK